MLDRNLGISSSKMMFQAKLLGEIIKGVRTARGEMKLKQGALFYVSL